MEVCKAKKQWWVEFALKNTGNFAFRSVSVVVQDVKKDIVLSRVIDGFDSMKGCKKSAHLDTLQPGKSVLISSEAFSYNLTNHDLRAWIILCVQVNQGGACVQRTIKFKP